jgi:hypothetical protein
MTLSTYAHLFDELDDGDHRPAADQIREAREGQKCPKVSILCPPEAADPSLDAQKHRITRAFAEPTPGIEPGTPSLRVAHLQGNYSRYGRFEPSVSSWHRSESPSSGHASGHVLVQAAMRTLTMRSGCWSAARHRSAG